MNAALIFDGANDLVFGKWNYAFMDRLVTAYNDHTLEPDVPDKIRIAQYLAPVITSQRVMAAQFGNTYSSIQCKDQSNIVFEEMLDHVFIIVSDDTPDEASRELMDFKTFVQHICGQNMNLIHSPTYQNWVSALLESRIKGDSIPGASGIIGETGATAVALNALKAASKDIKLPYSHSHLMLFVGDKLLALYSSRGSEDLAPPDLILLSIQCVAAQEFWQDYRDIDSNDHTKEFVKVPWLSAENSAIVNLCAGSGGPCAPHSMHIAEVAPRITLVVVVDLELREVGAATFTSNQVLINIKRVLLQRALEMLPSMLDSLEASLKKTTDALRKNKANANLCARLTSRMLELRKSCTTTTPLTPETTATAMQTALEAVIEQLKPDIPSLKLDQPLVGLKEILAPYVEFLCVKAKRYFSMAPGEPEPSCSLTLHKYVEEFPGLIHFIYVDRTTGRFLAPDMADAADMLTQETIRRAIGRTFSIIHEGYCAGTWRRGALHGCSLLWWERRGVPVRPKKTPNPAVVRTLPSPGDIQGTFYKQLLEMAFPGETRGVTVKELICIHLGLVPASTAVQQSRRLIHLVNELAGDTPAGAADLL
ncbi:Hermansky-Pudlak syndrome 1 protein [Anticarsia gemmatalis]|uniref:Hermansky-Pudlak syndrome 1 protein n=1 Tax=Anticarsia gemmatalis TaxID=129554 RepID=UPI003F76ECE6